MKKLKSRLNFRNPSYQSGQKLSSHLLSKNPKLKIHLILNAILHACETWFLLLGEKWNLCFKNRVLWKRHEPKREEV
jgi:hypothetical protein